ncbi:MAG: hypothetical protein AABW73_01020 [Nanoarchaeota archaeon]
MVKKIKNKVNLEKKAPRGLKIIANVLIGLGIIISIFTWVAALALEDEFSFLLIFGLGLIISSVYMLKLQKWSRIMIIILLSSWITWKAYFWITQSYGFNLKNIIITLIFLSISLYLLFSKKVKEAFK